MRAEEEASLTEPTLDQKEREGVGMKKTSSPSADLVILSVTALGGTRSFRNTPTWKESSKTKAGKLNQSSASHDFKGSVSET